MMEWRNLDYCSPETTFISSCHDSRINTRSHDMLVGSYFAAESNCYASTIGVEKHPLIPHTDSFEWEGGKTSIIFLCFPICIYIAHIISPIYGLMCIQVCIRGIEGTSISNLNFRCGWRSTIHVTFFTDKMTHIIVQSSEPLRSTI